MALGGLQIGNLLASGFAGPNMSLLQSLLREGAVSLTRTRPHTMITSNGSPPPLGPCSNGVEYAKQSSADMTEVWISTYYDAACSLIYSEVDAQETLAPGSTTTTKTTNVSETQQYYAKSGQQVSYTSIAGTFVVDNGSLASVSEQMGTSQGPQSPTISNSALACTYTNGAASACGSASVAHSSAEDLGTALSFPTFSMITTSDGGTQYTLSGNVSTYSGNRGALVINPIASSINWSVTGGDTVGSADMSGTFDFNAAGVADGGNVTTNDATDNITVSVAIGSDGSTVGTIKFISTGGLVATFDLDATGTGTITYADSSTANIVNFELLD